MFGIVNNSAVLKHLKYSMQRFLIRRLQLFPCRLQGGVFTFLIQSQQNPVDSVIMIIRMLIQDFIYFLKQNLPCFWLVPVSFPLVKACFADRKNFAKFFY